MLKSYFSLILFFCSFGYTFAQVETEVIHLGGDNSEEVKKKSNNHDIAIKTDLISFILGYQEVNLEYGIVDWMSIQAGVGMTFKKYLDFSSIIEDESFESTNRKYKPGPRFSIGPKFYFGGDAIEGWFLAPTFIYSKHKYDDSQGSSSPDDFERVILTQKEFMLRSGYQKLYDVLTIEYFFGLGIRGRNNSISDFNNGTSAGTTTFDESKIGLEFGLKMGFHF